MLPKKYPGLREELEAWVSVLHAGHANHDDEAIDQPDCKPSSASPHDETYYRPAELPQFNHRSCLLPRPICSPCNRAHLSHSATVISAADREGAIASSSLTPYTHFQSPKSLATFLTSTMSAMPNTDHTGNAPQDYNKETNGTGAHREMSHEEHQAAKAAARFGYGPLAHVNTSSGDQRLPAFGGEFQPGLYKQVKDRRIANPAPLGLSAFALTTFVLGLVNMGTRGLSAPNLVVGIAFGYGGLVQLLAGMWYVYF